MKCGNNFQDKICPICGKKFIACGEQIYKVNGKIVCSYGCVIKAEKEKERKKKCNALTD